MNTMTCSMPQVAGSGNRSSMSCARGGARIERSLQPSATPPAAVAAVVKNLRREMSDIETPFVSIVVPLAEEVVRAVSLRREHRVSVLSRQGMLRCCHRRVAGRVRPRQVVAGCGWSAQLQRIRAASGALGKT